MQAWCMSSKYSTASFPGKQTFWYHVSSFETITLWGAKFPSSQNSPHVLAKGHPGEECRGQGCDASNEAAAYNWGAAATNPWLVPLHRWITCQRK